MVAVPGEELLLPVSIFSSTRALIGFAHVPLSSNNTYIDERRGGVTVYPMNTWDDVSYLTPNNNQPQVGWTNQSLLGFAELTNPPNQVWLNAADGPTIFYYKMLIHNNPSWVGQTDSIFAPGYNPVRNGYLILGDSTGSIQYPTIQRCYPVTFRTCATGSGYGVMGNFQNNVAMHHNGNPIGFRLQDISRRLNAGTCGSGGYMRDDQSIFTYQYDGTNPGDTIINSMSSFPAGNPIFAAGIDAHVYSGLFYDFLLSEFGRNSYDDTGSSMICTVEDTTATNNAEWVNDEGRVIFYISGPGKRTFASCPESVGHEFSHGISFARFIAPYEKESGAWMEAFSNMMGASARWVYAGRPFQVNWELLSNFTIPAVPLYSMKFPHGDSIVVIEHRPDFYLDSQDWHPLTAPPDNYGVHTNSGVPEKMFQLLSDGGTSVHNGVQVTGIGVDDAIQIMYETVAHYMAREDTTFLFMRYVTINTALNYIGNRSHANQVANAWNAVGVCDSCNYTPGDANNNGVVNGIDVNYLTDYFKGRVPATVTCNLAYRTPFVNFYAPADCNGSCGVNGVDITYLVAFLKGTQSPPMWCPHFTPETP